MALNSTITCIFVPGISETCDQKPFQNRVAIFIHLLDRPGFLSHFLVVSAPLKDWLQDPRDEPDAPRAEMVPQSGNRACIRVATRAVQRLRRDVALHRDAR